MFVPNFKPVLVVAVVATIHLALLFLMIGQSPDVTQKPLQVPVIQGMLVAAAPPPPVIQKKVIPKPKPRPKPKPKPKPLVQKQKVETAPAIIEEPLPESLPEPVDEPIAEEIEPEEAPPPAQVQTAEATEVMPPRVDAYQHNNSAPKYPRLSKRLREEGTVLLELLISKEGTVNEVAIKESSGYPRLDRAAMKAVKRWRYTPAHQGNETIAYRYEQPVRFSMN